MTCKECMGKCNCADKDSNLKLGSSGGDINYGYGGMYKKNDVYAGIQKWIPTLEPSKPNWYYISAVMPSNVTDNKVVKSTAKAWVEKYEFLTSWEKSKYFLEPLLAQQILDKKPISVVIYDRIPSNKDPIRLENVILEPVDLRQETTHNRLEMDTGSVTIKTSAWNMYLVGTKFRTHDQIKLRYTDRESIKVKFLTGNPEWDEGDSQFDPNVVNLDNIGDVIRDQSKRGDLNIKRGPKMPWDKPVTPPVQHNLTASLPKKRNLASAMAPLDSDSDSENESDKKCNTYKYSLVGVTILLLLFVIFFFIKFRNQS